jgi:ferredoxin
LLNFFKKLSIFSLRAKTAAPGLLVVRTSDQGTTLFEKSFAFRDGQSVLDVALENKIRIATSCGGMGTCGTCRVEVLEAPARFNERNEIENEMAKERGFSNGERLACQIEACPGLKVFIPETSVED